MSWDYEFAAALSKLGNRQSTGGPSLLEGTVVNTRPLTVSFAGGEVMAPPMKLDAVVCAQGVYRDAEDNQLYLDRWQTGDRCICCLVGDTAIILGKLGGPDWTFPVR